MEVDRLPGDEKERPRRARAVLADAEASLGLGRLDLADAALHRMPKELDPKQTLAAELMQARNRWDEAIPHWKQVAELRRLEPTGLVKLATAQIHEKKWDDARTTVRQLQQTSWPARFNDVEQQTRALQEQLPKK